MPLPHPSPGPAPVPPASMAGQTALWSAANLAGMDTLQLSARQPFFRKLIQRLMGKRPIAPALMRYPSPQQSLPILADAVVGSSRSMLYSVFGPPRAATLTETGIDTLPPTFWTAQTWYYALPRQGAMAMAISFDEDYAQCVEFLEM